MPYFSPSDLTSGLVRAVYEQGIIVDFNWGAWQETAEQYYREPERLNTADLDTLRRLLTLHIRKDRFCDGHLGAMLEQGHITAILRRMIELRQEVVGLALHQDVAPAESNHVLDIPALLTALAKRRPVFHSEADFQHALAWEIQTQHPDANVRLEYRPPALTKKAYIDIWVRLGNQSIAIELKYKTRARQFVVNGERFDLLDQSAQDLGRYDFLKDVERLQRLVDRHESTIGYAILLTNDRGYWNAPNSTTTADAAFRLYESRAVAGSLGWGATASAGTMKGRENSLDIRSLAPLCWRDYSQMGDQAVGDRFRYLVAVVQAEG